MTEQKFDINNLRIAAPCTVGWETMSGDARRRFCGLCKLNVYNFSEMTAGEIQRLIAESEGRICGRFYRRADGTVLTKDCPVGLRAYRKRAARIAGAALTAILGLFSVSFGQKEDGKTIEPSNVKIVRTISFENGLSGTIVDEGGAAVSNAEITLRRGKFVIRSTRSGEDGAFSISSLTDGNYSLEIVAPGFEKLTINDLKLSDAEKCEINLKIELIVEAFMGMVVTIDEPALNSEPLENPPVNKKPEKPD